MICRLCLPECRAGVVMEGLLAGIAGFVLPAAFVQQSEESPTRELTLGAPLEGEVSEDDPELTTPELERHAAGETTRPSGGNAMRRLGPVAAMVVLAALILAGCLVSDEITTITIRPDGSADVVLYRANLRSSETGAQGDRELRDHAIAFDSGTDADRKRIQDAGGEILEARWLRRGSPSSTLIAAKLPTAASLEKYFTIRGGEGDVRLEGRLTQEGDRRRLALALQMPKDFKPETPTPEETRQKRSDAISETRIAVEEGEILRAVGFTVASDRRSALLSIDDLLELLRADPRRVELLLEWRVRTK